MWVLFKEPHRGVSKVWGSGKGDVFLPGRLTFSEYSEMQVYLTKAKQHRHIRPSLLPFVSLLLWIRLCHWVRLLLAFCLWERCEQISPKQQLVRETSHVSLYLSLPSPRFPGKMRRKCVCSQQKSRWLAIQGGGEEVWWGEHLLVTEVRLKILLNTSLMEPGPVNTCVGFFLLRDHFLPLEFSFMVPGQPFYWAVDHFYPWNIEWKCVGFCFVIQPLSSVSVLLMQRLAAPGEQQVDRSVALLQTGRREQADPGL